MASALTWVRLLYFRSDGGASDLRSGWGGMPEGIFSQNCGPLSQVSVTVPVTQERVRCAAKWSMGDIGNLVAAFFSTPEKLQEAGHCVWDTVLFLKWGRAGVLETGRDKTTV